MKRPWRDLGEMEHKQYLDDECPEALYIIPSGHYAHIKDGLRYYYVFVEDPFSPATVMETLLPSQIKEKYGIDIDGK